MAKTHQVDEAFEVVKEKMREPKEDAGDDALRLEMARRKLSKMDKDTGPEVVKLMTEVKELSRKQRVRRLKKELAEVESGDFDSYGMIW